MPPATPLDLTTLRHRLAGKQDKHYWRSLEELAETDEFVELLHREFPRQASEWTDRTSRRNFLKLMGASLALAGLGGCSEEPHEKILPYVNNPEHIVPGKPLFFATALALHGYGAGVLVESHMGRPTKIEGNPLHPAVPFTGGVDGDERQGVGATDIYSQAAVLGLYDPDRSASVRNVGTVSTWPLFLAQLNSQLAGLRRTEGRGLRILTETLTSPTLGHLLTQLREQFPESKWYQYEPAAPAAAAGARLAFGRPVETRYNFSRADVILSLDADFLAPGPGHLVYAREFIERRQVLDRAQPATMNRLYVAETTCTLTGAKADHRLPVDSRTVAALARAVAARVGVSGIEESGEIEGVPADWLDALVDDLQNYRVSENGASLVIAGDTQPPAIHALAHAINDALGNVGKTVAYTEPVALIPETEDESTAPFASLARLVEEMQAGDVETLLILGGNPAFTAPADLDFAAALEKVPFVVHHGLYHDETALLCDWHVPEAHPLESWGDVRAFDGTVTIQQPLIAPLYSGRTTAELISAVLGEPRPAYDIVRGYWREQVSEDFETFWETALHEGLVPDTEVAQAGVTLSEEIAAQQASAAAPDDDTYELVFRPDPCIHDGRFANNGWLQELPKPLSTITWDNAAYVSAAAAEKLGLQNGDLVEIESAGRVILIPVWILPGHPKRTVTLFFGYGRTHAGRVGNETGFNVYPLRTTQAPWFARGTLRKAEGSYTLATTQRHFQLEGRDHVRDGTLDEYNAKPEDPAFAHAHHEVDPADSFYPEYQYDGYKWGMSVNLGACIGCNACVVACQSENNIPIVGKDQVDRSREMHWLRIDTYYEGDLDDPAIAFQPMACVHCEKAPCEVVCPVAATTHSSEGLNEMTYNRCVGTRYCSNNCPYKVRRFNFLHYTAPIEDNPVLHLLQNPDVTVRSRGVMEKCTYCVQRISAARITAETENRRIRDGEVVTACQAACPTQTIVFGDLNDKTAEVVRRKQHPLDYGVLAELNTQPRTTYLAALKNPNPKLVPTANEQHAR